MIEPEDILRKAENLYRDFLRAWLSGTEFFPRSIPCNKDVDENLAKAAASVQRLKAESKEEMGFGYMVEWEERNSRTHGRNRFPSKIVFETREDFVKYIGKRQEFADFAAAVERLRAEVPELERWISGHARVLIEAAPDLDGLLEVVGYLRNHPRPGLFARELPLSVDTKFIERNHRILHEWLDLVLPAHAIRADEEHFDRRFGLRYVEPQILIRFLDEVVQNAAGSPWSVCSVPLHTLARQPIPAHRVLIVENKVNLLALPPVKGAVAFGGLGNGVTDLRYVRWLAEQEVWYWGDIDMAGLAILSRLRTFFGDGVRSLLMDDQTIADWRSRIGAHRDGVVANPPANLTRAEAAAFTICATDNLWIEQERFPQEFVHEHFVRLFATPMTSPAHVNDTDFEDHLAQCVLLACRLEAMARKPGNVHPNAAFADLTFQDFVSSAEIVAPILARTGSQGVGQTVLSAVEQTQAYIGRNTNLGIVLLMAPLAAISESQTLREGLPDVLARLSRADAEAVYRAIRLARPGGLGKVDAEDVSTAPQVTLMEAMRLAADRDAVAAQYANGFQDVLEFGLPLLAATHDFSANWEVAIVELHLRLMVRLPDTLIARKCGIEIAKESAANARQVLDAGWPHSEDGRLKLQQLDAWLRADGNRRNPGTTADFVAACLFAGFRERILDTSTMAQVCHSRLFHEQFP